MPIAAGPVSCKLSTPDQDLLIDPLSISDISPLHAVFANPQIEKVFHAAEYDLICLKRDFDFDVHPVFDTMAAARVCGYKRIGLSNMLEDLLGVNHAKKHQKADWAQRPLTESKRRYAQMDTALSAAASGSLGSAIGTDGWPGRSQ